MAHEKNHDYHILHPSIWPFLGAVSGFIMLFGAVLWFHDITPFVALIGLVGCSLRHVRAGGPKSWPRPRTAITRRSS